MASSNGKSLFYNLTLIMVLAVILLLSMLGGSSVTSLALEQEVRCGQTEHTHSEECYIDEVLLCTQKAHTHSENCYLILLEDNDINWLLQTMDTTRSKSLEGIIDSALVQALALNDGFREAAPPLQLSAQDISSLNHTITDHAIEPSVVLNEDLHADATLTYAQGDGGVSTLAVGGTPSTRTRAVNFYILLDGQITFVNSGSLSNSNPDYYSYTNTVDAYKNVVRTNLSTGRINSTYYFRYNTTGRTTQVSDFSTDAAYSNNSVTFGNSYSVRYALLTNRSDQAIPFYTVKLDYSQSGTNRAQQVEYVESGMSSTLPLSNEFLWYDAAGNRVSAMPATITQTTVLYARPKAITASFVDASGTQIHSSYSAEPVNGSITVTLPDMTGTAYEGYYWIKQGSDGTTYYKSDGSVSVAITEDTVFQAVPGKYTLTYIDSGGNATAKQADYRQTVTLDPLPEGYYWYDSQGTRYNPGSTYGPVTEDMTFTAGSRILTITYQVNFPSGAVSSVDSVPTIHGTGSASLTESLPSTGSTVIRTLTSRTARREIGTSNKESITYFFQGWKIAGTDILIQPDTTLSGQLLETYADSNGNIALTGVWDEGAQLNSVTFFVRFDSQAVDTNGNITSQPVENYTPEIFNTHVGGVDESWSTTQIKQAYEIADTTSDNSFTADRNIRALYGEKAQGIWLYEFPKDADVFTYLKTYLQNNPSRQLTVDGVAVDPSELDDRHYAIRWYVFKLEGSSWHIDGKLVRKVGTITVDKRFGGVEAAVSQAESGFYIFAENGTKNSAGIFEAYPSTHKDFQQVVMTLNQTTANNLKAAYPNAKFHVVDAEDWANNNFEWVITDVTLGEYWHITEYPTDVPGYSYYAEYSIYDTDGEYSAIAEYGTNASVVGKTFALDEDPDQGMMVDFANYYYPNDSILLKKEDATTGSGIGGAIFEIWQNGRALKFHHDAQTGRYTQDPDGSTTRIQTGADGFAVIEGFSYLHGDSTGDGYRDGDITIKEIVPPSGYSKAPDAELGLNSAGNVILKDVAGIPAAEWSKHASVPDNDVAVIRDHVSEYISVTAKKVWNTTTPADSVEVVLQANGGHAAALFPGMTTAQVKLHAGNTWTYTWNDLPRYANGKEVTWGIKEVVVGGMPTLADGSSFANWIVTYSPGVSTDADGDGDVDNWSYTVTNAIRRPQLIVTKIGSDNVILPGATFTLEQVALTDGTWQPVSGSTVSTMTTNENGMLTFDQLMAGSYYRLTETHPPEGYIGLEESVILTVNGEGLVQMVNTDGSLTDVTGSWISHTGPYNIQVSNLKLTPLPETGGVGIHVYRQSGWLLMLAAAALWIYKLRRKEVTNSS